jgi:hypothetical protein
MAGKPQDLELREKKDIPGPLDYKVETSMFKTAA